MGIGDCFGEVGLLQASNRTATVRCTRPVSCFVLKKKSFESVTSRSMEELESETRVMRLRGVPILSTLDAHFLSFLSQNCEKSKFADGQTITRSGHAVQALFVVESGTFGAYGADGKKVATLSEGSYWGDMVLFQPQHMHEHNRFSVSHVSVLCESNEGLCYMLSRDVIMQAFAQAGLEYKKDAIDDANAAPLTIDTRDNGPRVRSLVVSTPNTMYRTQKRLDQHKLVGDALVQKSPRIGSRSSGRESRSLSHSPKATFSKKRSSFSSKNSKSPKVVLQLEESEGLPVSAAPLSVTQDRHRDSLTKAGLTVINANLAPGLQSSTKKTLRENSNRTMPRVQMRIDVPSNGTPPSPAGSTPSEPHVYSWSPTSPSMRGVRLDGSAQNGPIVAKQLQPMAPSRSTSSSGLLPPALVRLHSITETPEPALLQHSADAKDSEHQKADAHIIGETVASTTSKITPPGSRVSLKKHSNQARSDLRRVLLKKRERKEKEKRSRADTHSGSDYTYDSYDSYDSYTDSDSQYTGESDASSSELSDREQQKRNVARQNRRRIVLVEQKIERQRAEEEEERAILAQERYALAMERKQVAQQMRRDHTEVRILKNRAVREKFHQKLGGADLFWFSPDLQPRVTSNLLAYATQPPSSRHTNRHKNCLV
jgi:CRP-like cAMP-binding protein